MANKIKSTYLIIAGILLIGGIFLLGSVISNYQIDPKEVHSINKDNLIPDGGFEDFNKTSGDCCKMDAEIPIVFASKSEDSYEGSYSLNLTSSNRCACTNFPVSETNSLSKYILSFYYKGDNPRMCNWVNDDQKCMPELRYSSSIDWLKDQQIISLTEKSRQSLIYFYADSRDGKTVTNLYDDLRVHKLIPIENPEEYEYNPEEEYIFKTKADNKIHDAQMLGDLDAKTGEAYFITKGKPNITIKFPLSEIVIIILIILIIVRLLFKKQFFHTEHEIRGEVNQIIKRLELKEK